MDNDNDTPSIVPRRPTQVVAQPIDNDSDNDDVIEARPTHTRTPYNDINERKRSGKKGEKLSDEDILDLFDDYLKMASSTKCLQVSSRKDLRCDCLSVLKDRNSREAVSKFCLHFGEQTNQQRINTAIEWCKYARPDKLNNKAFLIPFDCGGDDAVLKKLKDQKICVSALCKICGFVSGPPSLRDAAAQIVTERAALPQRRSRPDSH